MRSPLELFVRSILRGRPDAVELAPPLWEPESLRFLARQSLVNADLPPWPDPRHLAVMLGLSLLPRAPRGLCGEGTVPGVIAFAWGTDAKHRGLLIAHGIAHSLLRRQPEDSNEADAWILTALLLLPARDRVALGLSEIEARAWAPSWFVRAALGADDAGEGALEAYR